MQFLYGFADAIEGFDKRFFWWSVRETDAVWGKECATGYSRYMRFLQEIHREIIGVADRLLLSVFIGVMFAKEFADFWEEVESALRNGDLKAWNLLLR